MTTAASSRLQEKRASFSVAEDDEQGSGCIKITKPNTESSIEAYVGFLQVYHKYSIKLGIPLSYCGSSISCETNAPGLRVISIKPENKVVAVLMEYLPPDTKVGSIIEKLKIKSKIDKSELSVYVHLEVLGRTQGKPSLKEGVTCIETTPEFLTEPSEWTPATNET